VANALGAVVGSVRQSQRLTITSAGGKRVRVHAASGPREFDELEEGAQWCIEELTQQVRELATQAGAVECEIEVERVDNIVEKDGQSVFFESVITVYASGRPATAYN